MRVRFFLCWGVLLTSLARAQIAYEKIYCTVELDRDGSVRITQDRTRDFSTPGAAVSVLLSDRGTQRVVLERAEIMDRDSWRQLAPLGQGWKNQGLRLDWRNPGGAGRKRFRFQYRLPSVLRGGQRTRPVLRLLEAEPAVTNAFVLVVSLPDSVPGNVRVTGKSIRGGMDWNSRTDPARGRAVQSCIDLSLREPLDIEIDAPGTVFPPRGFRPRRPDPVSTLLVVLGGLLVLLPFGLVSYVLVRHRREPTPAMEPKYLREPPRAAPPMAVAVALNPQSRPEELSPLLLSGVLASLLELVRRRFASMRTMGDSRERWVQFRLDKPERLDELDPLTRKASEFLFREVGNSQTIVTDVQIKSYLGRNPVLLAAFLEHLEEEARQWWLRELGVRFLVRPLVPSPVRFGMLCLLFQIIGVIMSHVGARMITEQGARFGSRLLDTVLSFRLAASADLVVLLLPVIPVVVFVILGRLFAGLVRPLEIWNAEFLRECRRWRAYRRFIIDFSALEQAPVEMLAIWEDHYVHAVAMGVTEAFLARVGMPEAVRQIYALTSERDEWAVSITRAWLDAAEQVRDEMAESGGPAPAAKARRASRKRG